MGGDGCPHDGAAGWRDNHGGCDGPGRRRNRRDLAVVQDHDAGHGGELDAITGATNAAYMVMEGDTGYYLRVMATYTDAVGTDTAMVDSMPTMMVTEMMGVVDKYDANENGEIERAEVFAAIDDYLDGGADAPTRADVFKLIEFYLGD